MANPSTWAKECESPGSRPSRLPCGSPRPGTPGLASSPRHNTMALFHYRRSGPVLQPLALKHLAKPGARRSGDAPNLITRASALATTSIETGARGPQPTDAPARVNSDATRPSASPTPSVNDREGRSHPSMGQRNRLPRSAPRRARPGRRPRTDPRPQRHESVPAQPSARGVDSEKAHPGQRHQPRQRHAHWTVTLPSSARRAEQDQLCRRAGVKGRLRASASLRVLTSASGRPLDPASSELRTRARQSVERPRRSWPATRRRPLQRSLALRSNQV